MLHVDKIFYTSTLSYSPYDEKFQKSSNWLIPFCAQRNYQLRPPKTPSTPSFPSYLVFELRSCIRRILRCLSFLRFGNFTLRETSKSTGGEKGFSKEHIFPAVFSSRDSPHLENFCDVFHPQCIFLCKTSNTYNISWPFTGRRSDNNKGSFSPRHLFMNSPTLSRFRRMVGGSLCFLRNLSTLSFFFPWTQILHRGYHSADSQLEFFGIVAEVLSKIKQIIPCSREGSLTLRYFIVVPILSHLITIYLI